jgi:hypothetical protein
MHLAATDQWRSILALNVADLVSVKIGLCRDQMNPAQLLRWRYVKPHQPRMRKRGPQERNTQTLPGGNIIAIAASTDQQPTIFDTCS